MRTRSEFKRAHAKADKRHHAARVAVYATVAPRNDIRFNDCYAQSSVAVRDEYDRAYAALLQIEIDAIAAGVAYPGPFGLFTWTLRPCRTIRPRRAA